MRKILILLTIIGVIAGGLTVLDNDMAEWRHREVEIAVDFGDVQGLAREANVTDHEMLSRLKDMGATAVGLRESPVVRYRREGSITVALGSELIHNWRLTGQSPERLADLIKRGDVLPEASYLITDNSELAARLEDKARLKLKKPVRSFYNSAPYVVEIAEEQSRVLSLRIGLDPRDAALARELGLRVVARPDNQFLKDAEAVSRTLAEFTSLPRQELSAVIFEGPEVTGFPGQIGLLAEALNDADLPFGIIEYNQQQAGTARLAPITGYRSVLVHSNWPNETIQSIVNSVRERRVRLVYLRFNLNDLNVLKNGTALFQGVVKSLTEHGYRGGPAASIATGRQNRPLLVVILLGLAAACTLLLLEMTQREHPLLYAVLAVSFFGLLGACVVLPRTLALQLASILAAIVFATLAVLTQQLNRVPAGPKGELRAYLWAVIAMLRTFVIAAAGGAVVLGLTSTAYFASGTALFRGVKLVHTLPVLLVGVMAVLRIAHHDRKRWSAADLLLLGKRFMAQPILVVYMIFLVAFAVLAFIYVGRTGHRAGVPVPAAEVQMRLLLGEFLSVRPRFKEFLIGYPLSLLGLSALGSGSRGPLTTLLVTFGAIAPVSMVNTFMHFTTPFYNTIIRSFNGLWLGLLLGTLLTLGVLVLVRVADWVART